MTENSESQLSLGFVCPWSVQHLNSKEGLKDFEHDGSNLSYLSLSSFPQTDNLVLLITLQ